MKALHARVQDEHGPGVPGDITARVTEIFQHFPMLCGFSVQEGSTLTRDRRMLHLAGGLCLADVAMNMPSGFCVTQEFCAQIACMLLDLIDEQPALSGFLAGRTFARTVH